MTDEEKDKLERDVIAAFETATRHLKRLIAVDPLRAAKLQPRLTQIFAAAFGGN